MDGPVDILWCRGLQLALCGGAVYQHQREFFIDNLLVRIHLIIKMFLVDRPCAMGV